MSNFYPSSSAQVDVLSAPYVQDQKFTSYSESPIIHGNMMMYIHGAPSGGPFSEIPPGNSLSTHNSIDIPSMAGRNEMMFIPPTTGYHIPAQTINGQSIEGEQNLNGLSLSLSTQLSTAIPPAPFEQFSNAGISPVGKVDEACQNSMRFGNPNNLQELVHHKAVGYNVNQYEQGGNARVIIKSRFLKAVQQLLDEVVNVQDALKQKESAKERSMKRVEDGNTESKEKSASASDVNESGSGPSEELSATQRQDLQNKLDKLLAMLDEVDRRYKQYYHQMQILVSSFETIAGCGAAKPYTTLALKTISRHFRSLRDAISIQIQATRKSLGEQDSGQGVIPRLRYVDQHLRQQRALQQFGMMRHAWRPQRGLPENAVTILRAWLFEHFLHPYPKDSEKIMLARQTGLTRSQVGNWFINARVRLWKPMVEEMYKEEFGEADLNLKSSPENAPNNTAGEMSRTTQDWREELQEMNHSTGRAHFMVSSHGDDDDKHRRLTKMHDNPHNMNSHGFYPQYQNGLVVDNQVSLALGLQRIDGTTSRPGASAENAVGPETGEYSYFGQVNQQSKFGNSHLLDDFVV